MNKIFQSKICYLITFLLLSGNSVLGQKFVPIDSIEIPYPTFASIDKIGNIFISNPKGEIQKYNSFGKLADTFTPQGTSHADFFEAGEMLRFFVLDSRKQEYYFLDHLLNSSPIYNFNNLVSGLVNFATPDQDNSLWLVDEGSLSLKKYNLYTSQLQSETDLRMLFDENYEIYFLKAYQNKLYLSEKNSGILVFDNLGNFLRKLPFENVKNFNFFENSLYYLNADAVNVVDLKSLDQKKIYLPEIYPIRFCFLFENQAFIISNDKLYTCKGIGF